MATGKKINTSLVTLFIKIGDHPSPKVGIALNSKTFKKAVDRNRARRLVSATFESLYARLPNSLNIVVLPKRGVLEVKSGDLLLEIEAVLKNEKIIN